MQALVLAAGDGGRLYPLTADRPKPLLPVAGRPIIAHVIDALVAAGLDDITLVLGYRGEQVRMALESRAADAQLHFVENDGYMLGNARSLWSARGAIDGPFVLAMGDHLVEPAMVSALVDGAGERCRLAVDRCTPLDLRAREATRALVERGRVVELGKTIDKWNALDTGLFWCTPRVFDALTPATRDGELGAIFRALAQAGELDAVDVTGARWIDIDTPDDLAAAEAMLGVPLNEDDGAVA